MAFEATYANKTVKVKFGFRVSGRVVGRWGRGRVSVIPIVGLVCLRPCRRVLLNVHLRL